jgi:Holliday junction DNA helicase RuvA
MIARIEGTIIEKTTDHLVVLVGGIGYLVYTTRETLDAYDEGIVVSLATYLVVREDALDLYGFISNYEKDIFMLLLSVSGIGPKSAIGVLNAISAETLVRAISTGDTQTLSTISGIGRKTAEKIALELKDKIIKSGKHDARDIRGESEALLALEALGYRQGDVRDALRNIDAGLDTQTKIREALKILGR